MSFIESFLSQVKSILDHYAEKYNRKDFIDSDPISIPHRFSKKQDIEISAFWVATMAWGARKTIINSGHRLMEIMDNNPYDFMINHQESDRLKFERFVHRTFNNSDAYYFLSFFQKFYKQNESLEFAFLNPSSKKAFSNLEESLNQFHKIFFSLDKFPSRTRKHVSRPSSGSRCKRLIMFLRWMVRRDDQGVDFGIWNRIPMSQLMIPLDVHVERTARQLGLLTRRTLNWKAVVELSDNCRALRPHDPAYYDFALFGMSSSNELI